MPKKKEPSHSVGKKRAFAKRSQKRKKRSLKALAKNSVRRMFAKKIKPLA